MNRQETVYDMVQREAHAKVEAAHDWKGKLGWRFGFGYDFGYDEIKVCRRCGHSDVFAHAHGLTECEGDTTRFHFIRDGKRETDNVSKSVLAWHFVGERLRDGRPVPPDGVELVHDGPVRMCRTGLHASRRLIDALKYAPGNTLCRVEMRGVAEEDADKLVARSRTILWRIDAEPVLRQFARDCALEVLHLWDAPDAVVEYLLTGDDSLRDAAWDAADPAWDAADPARDDAWAAARATAQAAAQAAAWAAARDAARDAAWAAARATAWATRATAWNAAGVHLESLVMAAHFIRWGLNVEVPVRVQWH